MTASDIATFGASTGYVVDPDLRNGEFSIQSATVFAKWLAKPGGDVAGLTEWEVST